MTKTLNTTAIVNELKGNSSFFKSKPTEKSAAAKTERTEIRSEKRTVYPPAKRLTRRYSFEFYDDQINRIRQMKYEASLEGQILSMSDIVRQALDDYFQEQT